jgi:tripartite-type tricarboxylate transporter receptor subunit TctC
MTHVPYRGAAPALADMIGGQVQAMFDSVSSSIEHIRSGPLRSLGITTATRSPVLPEVPSIADFVAGFEVTTCSGVGAPRETPVERPPGGRATRAAGPQGRAARRAPAPLSPEQTT